jgi:ubiquitin carboxyl-terminal hydrolase 4/11/15
MDKIFNCCNPEAGELEIVTSDARSNKIPLKENSRNNKELNYSKRIMMIDTATNEYSENNNKINEKDEEIKNLKIKLNIKQNENNQKIKEKETMMIKLQKKIDEYIKEIKEKDFIINKLKNQIVEGTIQKVHKSKGLDNIGATCYMNATLQCLANIKPITYYLLNQKNYDFLYKNNDLCRLTLQYIQVLIGLFLSETINGSYCPENFKKTISELNPLFQGVQANDSKDLIIFLLETMNNELVSIHNKKHNINNNKDESYQEINISDENMVLDHFLRDFKKKYCTVIGSYLIGFNKSVFTCHNCNGNTISFNIFNLLIFSLEATSNYYNLGKNNNSIPVINFSHCFGYLSKR